LSLTARLQQLMLAAAHLAARNGCLSLQKKVESAGPAAANGTGLPQIAEHGPLYADVSRSHHHHHQSNHQQQQQQLPSSLLRSEAQSRHGSADTSSGAQAGDISTAACSVQLEVSARVGSKGLSPQQRLKHSGHQSEQQGQHSLSSSSSSLGYGFVGKQLLRIQAAPTVVKARGEGVGLGSLGVHSAGRRM